MNSQRIVIYERRSDILRGKNLKEEALEMVAAIIESKVWKYCPEKTYSEEWNLLGLREELRKIFLLDIHYPDSEIEELKQEKLIEDITTAAKKIFEEKEELLGEETMRRLERFAFLSVYDSHWKEHLYEMDHLKTGIGLRAYGQRDPVIEYKKEAFGAFEEMMGRIDEEAIGMIYKMKPATEPTRLPRGQMVAAKQSAVGMGVQVGAGARAAADDALDGPVRRAQVPSEAKQKPIRVTKTPGRNAPCPCGSGKKYKHCHGQ